MVKNILIHSQNEIIFLINSRIQQKLYYQEILIIDINFIFHHLFQGLYIDQGS
ncbi:hypothetical protein pb186bvf_016770 [Paramecium bursaria]